MLHNVLADSVGIHVRQRPVVLCLRGPLTRGHSCMWTCSLVRFISGPPPFLDEIITLPTFPHHFHIYPITKLPDAERFDADALRMAIGV